VARKVSDRLLSEAHLKPAVASPTAGSVLSDSKHDFLRPLKQVGYERGSQAPLIDEPYESAQRW